MSYGYSDFPPDWSNTLFIANPEDLQKELDIKDIGKEIFFLTKHAFCETCNKSLKAFASDVKAQAKVDKHLTTKKYGSHKAYVKTINFDQYKKCTTADISGTKANIERNQQIKDAYYGVVKGQIQRLIESNQELFERIQSHFGFEHRHENIPDEPRSIADGNVSFSNDRLSGKLSLNDLKDIQQLFDETDHPNTELADRHLTPFERSSTIWFYLRIGRDYTYRDIYHWDYPVSYDSFDKISEQVGSCVFCNKPIEEWNDVYESIDLNRGFVHRGCLEHAQEASSLESYAKSYAEKLEQEVITS